MAKEAPEVSEELVDQVVEYLGQRMRKSHIKAKLREIHPDVKICTVERLITLAKEKIMKLYQVDAEEFKGCSIEFYSMVIRDQKAPLKYRILCQQQLDRLLRLDEVVSEDPQGFAERVQEALKEMDGTIADKPLDTT